MTNYTTIAETKHFIVLDRYHRDGVVKEDYQSEDALERELIRDLENQGYTYATEIHTPDRKRHGTQRHTAQNEPAQSAIQKEEANGLPKDLRLCGEI